MKEARIMEQNSTIISMKARICQLEKTLATLESKFTSFQHKKPASNIAKLENKRELFEVKKKSKREKSVRNSYKKEGNKIQSGG